MVALETDEFISSCSK